MSKLLLRKQAEGRKNETHKKWNPKEDFDLCLKLLSICAINFGIFKNRIFMKKIAKYFEIIFDILLVYVMSVDLRASILIASSDVYACCAVVTTVFIIFLRIWFLRKAPKILCIVDTIADVYEKVAATSKVERGYKKCIAMCYSTCVIFAIMITVLVANRVYMSNHGRMYFRVIVEDFDTVYVNNRLIIGIITPCIIVSESIAYTTYLLAAFICCFFYIIVEKLFTTFCFQMMENELKNTQNQPKKCKKKQIASKKFPLFAMKRIVSVFHCKKSSHNGKESLLAFLNKNNKIFNKLIFLASSVDEAISACSFCLIGLSVSGIFETQSMSVLGTDSLTNEIMYGAFKYVLTALAFFVVCGLCFCASKVSKAAAETSENVRHFIAGIANHTENLTVEELIQMLIFANDCNNSTEVNMTGWQMFNINKGLILTVTGALVTYSVLIDQIMRTVNPTVGTALK